MRMMKKVLGTVTVLALLFPKRHPHFYGLRPDYDRQLH